MRSDVPICPTLQTLRPLPRVKNINHLDSCCCAWKRKEGIKNVRQGRSERERETGVKKVILKPEALKYGAGRVELQVRNAPPRRYASQCMPSLSTPRLRKTTKRPAAEFQQKTPTCPYRKSTMGIRAYWCFRCTQCGSGGTEVAEC